ncbi:MAG: helix-turn-helix transcriptional regulator [Bacteroidetes bacterium]|nr:helix-turn-helix transcriptional regulator [Bacteroidota bacterium]
MYIKEIASIISTANGAIAQRVHLNGRSFLRRFKKATANTPLEYIQRVKIKAAKKKLESTAKTILEVMYDIGYNDENAFRSTFKKYSGLSPKQYQRKYNKLVHALQPKSFKRQTMNFLEERLQGVKRRVSP